MTAVRVIELNSSGSYKMENNDDSRNVKVNCLMPYSSTFVFVSLIERRCLMIQYKIDQRLKIVFIRNNVYFSGKHELFVSEVLKALPFNLGLLQELIL